METVANNIVMWVTIVLFVAFAVMVLFVFAKFIYEQIGEWKAEH